MSTLIANQYSSVSCKGTALDLTLSFGFGLWNKDPTATITRFYQAKKHALSRMMVRFMNLSVLTLSIFYAYRAMGLPVNSKPRFISIPHAKFPFLLIHLSQLFFANFTSKCAKLVDH